MHFEKIKIGHWIVLAIIDGIIEPFASELLVVQPVWAVITGLCYFTGNKLAFCSCRCSKACCCHLPDTDYSVSRHSMVEFTLSLANLFASQMYSS